MLRIELFTGEGDFLQVMASLEIFLVLMKSICTLRYVLLLCKLKMTRLF